ncbi:MAG: hypothetical protein Q9178_001575 [Gyalolechia marmorata]
MVIMLSALLLLSGFAHVMSMPVSSSLSIAETEPDWLSGDSNDSTPIASDTVSLNKSIKTVPIPLPEIYHVKNSDAIIRLGFGAGTRIPIDIIFSLLLVCEDDVVEKIARYGEDGEMRWETGHRQIYSRDLGDGVRITIMNLAGQEVLWGEVRSVLQGLQEFLVDGRRGREVMFRFRFGAGPEVGWGFLAIGGRGGRIPHPPHQVGGEAR